mmetsp:Transcript_22175/g.79034  ORF Transcript_22175/g.79034 Transcript_22175/m.79034 type:complete len:313 (-) Transcript_22175:666-1604(-)
MRRRSPAGRACTLSHCRRWQTCRSSRRLGPRPGRRRRSQRDTACTARRRPRPLCPSGRPCSWRCSRRRRPCPRGTVWVRRRPRGKSAPRGRWRSWKTPKPTRASTCPSGSLCSLWRRGRKTCPQNTAPARFGCSGTCGRAGKSSSAQTPCRWQTCPAGKSSRKWRPRLRPRRHRSGAAPPQSSCSQSRTGRPHKTPSSPANSCRPRRPRAPTPPTGTPTRRGRLCSSSPRRVRTTPASTARAPRPRNRGRQSLAGTACILGCRRARRRRAGRPRRPRHPRAQKSRSSTPRAMRRRSRRRGPRGRRNTWASPR